MNKEKNKGTVYRITGLSGAGKTSVGTLLYEYMKGKKENVVLLDGDVVRSVLANDDHSEEGRKRQGQLVRQLAYFLTEQNIDVIMCNIGMVESERKLNRELLKRYYEIYLEVSMEELFRRDSKGLYRAALDGREHNVYGIDILTEYPENPDLKIKNEGDIKPKDALEIIIKHFDL